VRGPQSRAEIAPKFQSKFPREPPFGSLKRSADKARMLGCRPGIDSRDCPGGRIGPTGHGPRRIRRHEEVPSIHFPTVQLRQKVSLDSSGRFCICCPRDNLLRMQKTRCRRPSQ
jgi:hypothetical protein